MRYEHHGRNRTAGLFPEVEEDLLQLSSRNIVERAERLIEQKDLAAIGEHRCNGDPFEHAARKLTRPRALHRRKADALKVVPRNIPARSGRDSSTLETVLDIVDHAHPWKHAVALEDHSAFAARSVDLLAIDDDRARRGPDKARDHLQERALAATRRADQADKLALRNNQRHVVDRIYALSVRARIVAAEVNEFDHPATGFSRHLALRAKIPRTATPHTARSTWPPSHR